MPRVPELTRSGKTLIAVVFLLVVFGLIMLSSAGVVEGQRNFNSPYYFVWHQILYGVVPGAILFYFLSRIRYGRWRKFALPLLILAIGLMVAVFIPGIGRTLNGATRWVSIGGHFTFQPSELLKLALIMYLAAWFSGRQRGAKRSWSYSLTPFLLILGFIGVLLLLQPDFGTFGLIFLIAVALYFFSGAPIRHFLILILISGIIFASMAFISPYRFNRIKSFLNPAQDILGSSYHINQALITIGSGGLFGVGFGNSQQKVRFLPEPVGDSIFAIIVEELGLVGGMGLILLFLVLLFSLIYIARHSRDDFAKLFVLGMAVWVVGQAFINIGAISGLVPLTGLPLPFVSFGSSSLVAMLAGMGIAVSVARYS